jgi:hypothetical protein
MKKKIKKVKNKKIKKCKDGEHTLDDSGWDACPKCDYGEGKCNVCGIYCDNEGNEI